jgi:hypothetical protein
MDEFTADPIATEKEAQRVLRKMQADKNVAAAKAAESKAGVEASRAKLREMGYLKGDSSLEAKYPGAKITKVPPNEAPVAPKKLETPRGFIPQDVMPEYERKAEKFEKAKEKRGGSGGGSGVVPIDKMLKMNKMNYKAGGKVKTASSRADGCCIRGKTRA